jgi:hypothetical protein
MHRDWACGGTFVYENIVSVKRIFVHEHTNILFLNRIDTYSATTDPPWDVHLQKAVFPKMGYTAPWEVVGLSKGC